MDRETYEKQKPFAGEKKPSMLRRCVGHDYTSRQMYMVTMVTEGRRPLFGCSKDEVINNEYDNDLGYYTAKVISYSDIRVSASIISAPADSRNNTLPAENHRIIFSKSDLPGQIYQEGGVVSFRLKEARIIVDIPHDDLFTYWDCVVEPVK